MQAAKNLFLLITVILFLPRLGLAAADHSGGVTAPAPRPVGDAPPAQSLFRDGFNYAAIRGFNNTIGIGRNGELVELTPNGRGGLVVRQRLGYRDTRGFFHPLRIDFSQDPRAAISTILDQYRRFLTGNRSLLQSGTRSAIASVNSPGQAPPVATASVSSTDSTASPQAASIPPVGVRPVRGVVAPIFFIPRFSAFPPYIPGVNGITTLGVNSPFFFSASRKVNANY